MMNKNFAIVFVILALIAGCRPPTSGTSDSSAISGTDGLVMNFLAGAPPSKMYVEDEAEIPISIEIRNKGTYPAPKDKGKSLWETAMDDDVVFISGFDTALISEWRVNGENVNGKYPGVKLSKLAEALEGRSSTNPEGGYELLEFVGTLDLNNINIEKYSPNFLVTACYDYETRAEPNVCIDPEPFSVANVRKVCEISDITLSSQGAPVAITKVEVQPLSNSIQFKIHFKNAGKGDVIATDVLKKCSEGNLKKSDMDSVKLIRVQIGDEEYYWKRNSENLRCDATASARDNGQEYKGYVRLINGEGFVVCTLKNYKGDVQSAYTTPMYIEIAYGYRNTISKSVEIIKVPKPR
jgi:hypothetical protein